MHPYSPLAVCRMCTEPLHYFVRASTEETAHCEPCSEISSSRSMTVIIAFLCCSAIVLSFIVVLKYLPVWVREKQTRMWKATTQVYGV